MTGDIKLIKEIANATAKELQEEIDWEVLCEMLKEIDWVEVKLDWPKMTASLTHEIKEWCRANLKNAYHARGRTWIFSTEKDASMFILRWS